MFEIMRLMLVRDGKVAAHYLYDANGVRVYKVAGDDHLMNVNGAYQGGHAVLHTPTLYVSPYVVATPKGYTKHYYAGSERIASRIGGGGLGKLHDHVVNPEGKLMQMNERVVEGWRLHCFCREDAGLERSRSLVVAKPEPETPVELPPCSENEYTLYFNTELRLLYEYREIHHDEPETYFYHPDHLGSSSWITDQTGDAIQHLQYLPFGEPYVDQRTTGWNAPYTFSGKERDEETGYGYFGARYYDSDLSIWLSVDPLMHKYPSLSPYVYCANNPVILVDPDGMEISDHVDKFGNIIAHYDDGDNSVYQHSDGTTKSNIDQQRSTSNNTGGNGTKIGELGKSIDMSGIFNNKLSQSADEAKNMNIVDYYNAVKTGGDWDLKNNKNTIWGVAWAYDKENKTSTTFSCSRFSGVNAADVGNYHAGYTGTFAGIPNYLLWKGAGAAETYKSFSNGNIGDGLKRSFYLINPFSLNSGDQRRDFFYNTIGMDAARRTMK